MIEPTPIVVDLDGRTMTAEVVRSPRARITRIQIGRDRPLRVIVPAGATDEFARDALVSKSDWITRKLRAIEKARADETTLGLGRPGVVWVYGRPMRMVSCETARFAYEQDGRLLVPAGPAAVDVINRWYRRQARSHLRGLVAEEADRLGATPHKIVVRNQRTRWGSCSAKGTISLNWRLYLTPPEIARYVVVHELVHLAVPNHSKSFWRTLSVAIPGWERHAAWLRKHSDELRRYDVHSAVSAPSHSRAP